MQNKKILTLEIFIVIGLIVGLTYFFALRSESENKQPAEPSAEQTVNQIDFSPSTEEDAKFVEGIKEEIIQEEAGGGQQESSTAANITNASLNNNEITVTTAISGLVSGTCELTISDGPSSVVANDPTIQANAQSGCVQKVDVSALDQSADWALVVSVDLGEETIEATSTSRNEDR